jgi:hypothetical protein
MAVDDRPLPKLPVGQTIKLSYASYLQGFGDILRISWVWLLICAMLPVLANWVRQSWTLGMRGNNALTYSTALIVVLAGVSIAIAWHRRIILGEQRGSSCRNIITTEFWRYVGLVLPFGLMGAAPNVAMGLATESIAVEGLRLTQWQIIAMAMASGILHGVAFAIILRLSLVLPARAIGDRTVSFRKAWSSTRGNTWRMLAASAACIVLPVLLLRMIEPAAFRAIMISPAGALNIPMIWITILFSLTNVINLLIIPLGTGFLSHAYQHFLQGGLKPVERMK